MTHAPTGMETEDIDEAPEALFDALEEEVQRWAHRIGIIWEHGASRAGCIGFLR